jgi:hypothetical protein
MTVNQNMWVSRDTNIGRDLWVDNDINVNHNMRVNNDIFSSTSYDSYNSSANKKIVVNKGILDQVVTNITGGNPDTINALQQLIQSFNASDVSVLNSVITYQNQINNELLKKIDILYTHTFKKASGSLTLNEIFGTPPNVYYDASSDPPLIPYLSYNSGTGLYQFTQQDSILYNPVNVSGNITQLPLANGTEETITVSSSNANNDKETTTIKQTIPSV